MLKFCKRCNTETARYKDSRCKPCCAAYQKSYCAANPEKFKAARKAWYVANSDRTKANVKAWQAANPDKYTTAAKAWKAANPEKVKTAANTWAKSNPEKVRAAAIARYEANPEKARAKTRAWTKANPAKSNAATARRRATKLQATPAWTNKFFVDEIYDLAQRRTKATGFKWVVDHTVPLKSKKVCGLHWELNLAVIPEAENGSKGNRVWPDMP